MSKSVVDVIGIGFGPSNLALAICLQELGSGLGAKFFDAQSKPEWQREMLLSGSDIQNNPVRDLVTPRNPKSHFSFINYLKETGRLFEYLNLPSKYPLRREYAAYVEWVGSHFASAVASGVRTEGLRVSAYRGQPIWMIENSDGSTFSGRALVVGTGRTPNVPTAFQAILGERVFHLTEYGSRIAKVPATTKRIGIIGASQSAVEITLDLLGRFSDAEIYSIQRGFGFRLKDTSPFSDRVYFPEFVDYFYGLSPEGKANISKQLRATNYSSADADVIDALYVRVHEERLAGRDRFRLLNNTSVLSTTGKANGRVRLELKEVNTGELSRVDLDVVVLATGFLDLSEGATGEALPKLLAPFRDSLKTDVHGVLHVERDYLVRGTNPQIPPLYLNGLCESSHGLGDAGSFSLLSLRSETIARSLMRMLSPSPHEVIQSEPTNYRVLADDEPDGVDAADAVAR